LPSRPNCVTIGIEMWKEKTLKLYEVYNPDLDVNIRYKVLSQQETEALILEYGEGDRDRFTKAVLESVIYNLKPDVTLALRQLQKEKAKVILSSLFTGCLMLNPGLDVDSWLQITNAPQIISETGASIVSGRKRSKSPRIKRITKAKFLNLDRHLKDLIVGQNEAIEELVAALKRSQVGLGDEERPTGVFLFAGASGVGKTYLAKELHNYLFGTEYNLIRIDCGEYQHKHENQKLLGAPPGYLGHDEGGQLANELMKNPQTVVLLDEVEKAHPDIFHTFLSIFDEGMMTDGSGNKVSFRDAIIIMTTNLGNSEIVNDLKSVGFSKNINASALPRRERVTTVSNDAIKKQFPPEFLNRIDKIVVFNHLTDEDYKKIAELELNEVHSKLEKRGFTLAFDANVLEAMVRDGVNHVQGARGLAQLRRDRIENPLADLILNGRFPQGTAFKVSHEAGEYRVTANRPVSKKRSPKTIAPLVALPT
jgi:ATP-dependent Clp protease ATP-binding subunit ClpC